ncbi:putative RING-H2 finger protein ATL21A [Salvia splendens]|uniref:putative RING-H2 finger protein ATL21A n=1 Tax=Salvia splendens TaxID=180675 RepID=UPI001C254B58|nr:putative RING-H2 finger protein ATL21A [Salvia splendens]
MELVIKLTLFITFILSSHKIQAQKNHCPPQYCGTNPLPIQFPFTLQGHQQPQNCGGYPGFSLTCSGDIGGRGAPLLTLPYSRNFSVRYISYLIQEIQLYDADGCLPRKLMALNLTSSPFEAMYMDEFVFLSCPRAVVAGTGLATVDCLGNSTSAVVATTSGTLSGSMSMCTPMFTLPIPVSWDDGGGGSGSGDWLSSDVKDLNP